MSPSQKPQSPDDEIQIQTPFGQQFRLTRRELKDMLRQNALAPGTLFFEEGMQDWQPLRGIRKKPNSVTGQPARRLAAARQAHPDKPICTFARDPNRLTRVLKFFIWLYLFCCAAMLVSNLAEYLLLQRSYSEAEGNFNDLRQVLLSLFSIGIYLCIVVLFCKWVYRAYFNCHEFGAEGLSTTPGWAVGHYFIPIVCLFRPYGVMQEIDRVSINPLKWRETSPGFIVSLWWFLWLLNSAAGVMINRLTRDVTLEGEALIQRLSHLALVNTAAAFLEGLLTVAFLALISRVTFHQNALVAQSETLLQENTDPQDPAASQMPHPTMA